MIPPMFGYSLMPLVALALSVSLWSTLTLVAPRLFGMVYHDGAIVRTLGVPARLPQLAHLAILQRHRQASRQNKHPGNNKERFVPRPPRPAQESRLTRWQCAALDDEQCVSPACLRRESCW
jgi:hypothetical protein